MNQSSNYIFDGKSGVIQKYTGTSENCIIPDFIDGIEVKKIGEKAFAHCNDLVSLIIPDTVTDIGAYAFSRCEFLEHITLSGSLTVINRGVCAWCSSIKNIMVPSSVKKISEMAFAKCTGLHEIEIPPAIHEIGPLAFSGCKKLVICCDTDSVAFRYAIEKAIPYKIFNTDDVICTTHKPDVVTKLIDRRFKVTFVNDRVDQVSMDGKYETINIDQFNTLEMNFLSDPELVEYLYTYGDQIPEIKKLVMTNCDREVIHKTLSCIHLKRVESIEISNSNALDLLPETICDYSSLEWLDLTRNSLTDIPEDLGRLKSLKFLDISQNAIALLPQSLVELESLETLDASYNYLKELPSGFLRLSKLKNLFLSSNEFKHIPVELHKMESLKILSLQKNRINKTSKGLEALELKGVDISVK